MSPKVQLLLSLALMAVGVAIFAFGIALTNRPDVYDVVKTLVTSAGGAMAGSGLALLLRLRKRPTGR